LRYRPGKTENTKKEEKKEKADVKEKTAREKNK
jgi:hypothetical protein